MKGSREGSRGATPPEMRQRGEMQALNPTFCGGL